MDKLSTSLKGTLKRIANASNIDKELIDEVVKDIQRALIEADVNVRLVVQLTRTVATRALEEKPEKGFSSKHHVINIINQELTAILGEPKDIPIRKQTFMMVGLYGQGKTTTTGKLTRFFQKKGLKVGLIAGDVHRPGAVDQLIQLGKQVNAPVYHDRRAKDPVPIVKAGLRKLDEMDIVIVDTAGRHSLDEDLIDEMKKVHKVLKPDEVFLVMDASVGQQAGPQAQAFADAVGVSGVIVTKLDGTAKGGGAISAVQATSAPIAFIGVGEHMDDLEKFIPNRFISRLLGMGDIGGLLEAARDVVDEADAEEAAMKMLSGKMTLDDLYDQLTNLRKMGSMKKLMGLLPSSFGGMDLGAVNTDIAEDDMSRFKVVMDSMTARERRDPKVLKGNRLRRISRGAGVEVKDVKSLLRYYNRTRKAMKGFAGNRKMRKMMMDNFNIEDADGLFGGGGDDGVEMEGPAPSSGGALSSPARKGPAGGAQAQSGGRRRGGGGKGRGRKRGR